MRKSTRRSSIALAEVQDPVRNLSTRFSLKPYVKRVQQLTNEQRSAITKMGFGSLLLVPNHSLSKNLLAELMERWNCEKQVFILQPGEISMTLFDVALILGLRVVGNPVLLKDDEPFSDLEEEYGATIWKRKLTIASLESRLDSLGDSVSDDFVRAFLLYTIGAFLFPNINGKVDSRYLSFLRNLDDVCQFAWGAAVIEDLSQWLGKRKENNVQYVGGCLMFLQTWSYEHFDIGRPCLQDHDGTFPRLCRWDNSKSHQRPWFTSRFKDLNDDQVIWTLQPTSRELEIDIIKEALELQDDSKELQSAQNCSTCASINVPCVDSVLQLGTSNGLHREHEVNFENLTVEDTPTKLSTCDEVYRGQEVNLENLIVEDTPIKLSICDEVCIEQEVNPEKPIVEDIPTKLSICDEVRSDQEGNLEKLIVDDSPTKLNICDDDLRKRIVISEEENVELKKKLSKIMEENRLLKRQILLNSQFEVQNAQLKKELDISREENRVLRLLIDNYVTRMEKHILYAETNGTE